MPSEMFGRSAEPSELQMGAVRQGPQRIAALDHPIAVLVARWMHGVCLSSMMALHSRRTGAYHGERVAVNTAAPITYAALFPVKL